MRVWQASKQQLAPQGPFWSVEQKGPRNRGKKMLPRFLGWFSATFSGTIFLRSDPHVVGNGDLLVLWAPGTQRNSGTGPKTEKRNFLALGVPKSKKKITTLSGTVVRNFFTVLPDWTPRGGKSRNTGLAPSGRPS